METYGITNQLFSKVKNFINSQDGQFSRTELFKALYGEDRWTVEAVKPEHPLDVCTVMLRKCGYFVRPTVWSGIWIKTKNIPLEFTVQDMIKAFENLEDD